jgi:exonuclease SbcC
VVFVGRNGAGKSSVIDGITYAMYGKHTRGTNENLVRDDVASGSASVQFTVGTRRFIVERKLNHKGQLEGSVLRELLPLQTEEEDEEAHDTVGGDGDGADYGGGSGPSGRADRLVPRQIAGGERRQFGESTSAEVARVIGLDYTSMRVAAIIQQGELAKIVDMRPKETKDLINQLIGIDQLGAAHDAMPTLLAAFRERVRNKYGCDDTALPALLSRIEERKEIVSTSSKRLLTLNEELVGLRREEANLAAKLKVLEPLRDQAQKLQQQVETLVNYVKGARSTIEREKGALDQVIDRATASLTLLKEREGQLDRGRASLSEKESENEARLSLLSAEMATLDAMRDRPYQLEKVTSAARALLDLLSREEEITRRVVSTEQDFRELETTLARLNEEKGRYQGQLDIASRLEFRDGICPMCGSRVEKVKETFDKGELGKHLAEHSGLLASLQKRRDGVTRERDDAKAEAHRLVDARKFLDENAVASEEDVLRLEAERRALLPKLAALPSLRVEQAERVKARAAMKRQSQDLNTLETQLSIASAYLREHGIASPEDVERLRTETKRMEQALSGLPASVEGLKKERDQGRLAVLAIDDRARAMLEQVALLSEDASRFDAVEFERTSRELDSLRSTTIASKSAEVARCEADKARAEEELETFIKEREVADKVAYYVKHLQEIRERVYHRDGPVSGSMRSWALNQIGLKASEYSRLFGIGISSVALKEKNRDIAIECYRPRGMVKVESLSGGEKVAVALALRFAMAYVMGGYKLDFVILDEPTVYLDEERRASMVEIISALGGGGSESPLKQMIIITHDAEIFENANVDAVFQFESTPTGTVVKQALRQTPTLQAR